MLSWLFLLLMLVVDVNAARPDSYTELLDYVQEGPDQGETNTCLFVASTGAIELLSNKLHNIKNPMVGGPYDLSESYVIQLPYDRKATSFFDDPVLRFQGKAVHVSHWEFSAWNGRYINHSVWYRHPQFNQLPKVDVPEIETIKLFQYGNKWSTGVIEEKEIEEIKVALWKYKSPVLVNYNDDGYWHVILIVGYDDHIPGECYDTDPKECEGSIGAFYIRDSFGVPIEVRDYDWFRVKGNAAFVVKLRNPQSL